jgi:hypothetical protein
MLQISSKKFFTSTKLHETLHRGVYYTNYRVFGDAPLETPVGMLLPSTAWLGLTTMTYEIMERIEAHPHGPVAGEVVSIGGDTLVNDFAAIISFALNVTCTPDPDLTRRLTANVHPALGTTSVPQKFIPRMFDTQVQCKTGDTLLLSNFITELIDLDRKTFEGAMRAIRRYVTGAHRIAEDVNLAYALFVMSMESLAQEFDGHIAEWSDYDQRKRAKIDEALDDAPESTADKVRSAILHNEHVALARRFRDFTLAHVKPSFFREEAADAQGPLSRPDLAVALQQAYVIRSGYVHRLQEIPRALIGLPGFPETLELDGRTTLTFRGLSRVPVTLSCSL